MEASWKKRSRAVRLGLVADAHGTNPKTTGNLRRFGLAFSRASVRAVLVLGGMGQSGEELFANLSTLAEASRSLILFLPGHT